MPKESAGFSPSGDKPKVGQWKNSTSEASDCYEIQSDIAFSVAAVRELGSGPEHESRQHIAFRPGSRADAEPIRNSPDINPQHSGARPDRPSIKRACIRDSKSDVTRGAEPECTWRHR